MTGARLRGLRLVFLLALALAGCGGGRSFVGKWESNFGGVVELDLQADGKVLIKTMGIESEGTWEPKGKNQIVVHGPRQDMTLTLNDEGELTDGMLGVFSRAKD